MNHTVITRPWCLGLMLGVLSLVLDQWSKIAAFNTVVAHNGAIEVFPFFSLVMVWNPGVSFGMFGSLERGELIFSGIALCISMILCYWMLREQSRWMGAALGIIIGGALGNVIDRLRYGAVADFLDFHIGEYHWPAFNLADSAVCVGVMMIIIDGFRKKQHG